MLNLKDMTLQELITTLEKAQIPFSQKLTKWGSEYISIASVQYRISDHDKPSDHFWSGVDCNSYQEICNHVINVRNIDLKDMSKEEKEFKSIVRKESTILSNGEAKHSKHGWFDNIECLVDSAWNRKISALYN